MSKNYFAAFDFSKQAEKKLAEANVLPSGTPAEQAARRAAIITATNNLAEANKLVGRRNPKYERWDKSSCKGDRDLH